MGQHLENILSFPTHYVFHINDILTLRLYILGTLESKGSNSEPKISVVQGFSNLNVHTSHLQTMLSRDGWTRHPSPCALIMVTFYGNVDISPIDRGSISLPSSLGGTMSSESDTM